MVVLGFKEEEEVWAPLGDPGLGKLSPALVPSWSEAPWVQPSSWASAPGDGLSTKEGAKGLAGLGLGIGSCSRAGCRDTRRRKLHVCWAVRVRNT